MDLKKEGSEIQKLRIKLLFKQGPVTQRLGLLNVGIYFYICQGQIAFRSMLIWGGSAFLIYISRLIFQKIFSTKVERGETFDPYRWENIFAFCTFITGLNWAMLGTIWLPKKSIVHQIFLAFLIAGSNSGVAVAYSASFKTVLAFLLPSVIPFAIAIASEGTPLQMGMGLLMLNYVVLLVVLTFRMNRHVIESVRLRFELENSRACISQSAKMAALGEMAGGIAHEINNPLAIIQGGAALLREMLEENDVKQDIAKKVIDKIDNTVDRIAKIIIGLRAFARDGSRMPFETMALEGVISDTLDFCRSRFQNHGIELLVDPIPQGLKIHCNRIQISQVLLNLLNNAFDATLGRQGPWVKIEIEARPNQVILSVSDNGIGIPKEIRDKIMQPFFTTKEVGRGTGLGLSIAHGIVRAHNGSLNLDISSDYTRFSVALPRMTENSGRAAA